MKKVVALLLTVILLASLAVTCFAECDHDWKTVKIQQLHEDYKVKMRVNACQYKNSPHYHYKVYLTTHLITQICTKCNTVKRTYRRQYKYSYCETHPLVHLP